MSDPEPIDLSQLQNLSLAPDWVGDLQKREATPGEVVWGRAPEHERESRGGGQGFGTGGSGGKGGPRGFGNRPDFNRGDRSGPPRGPRPDGPPRGPRQDDRGPRPAGPGGPRPDGPRGPRADGPPRGPRQDDRGPRPGGPPRDDRRGGPDRREGGRPDFRNDRDRGPRRFDDRPHIEPLPGWRARLFAEPRSLEAITRQVKASGRAYPVFELGRLFLAGRDRYVVEFSRQPQAQAPRNAPKGTPVPEPEAPVGPEQIYQIPADGSLWLNRDEAIRHILNGPAVRKFYRQETISIDPPKGTFTAVAVCGFSGEILGPPNHHSFQTTVARLHREQFYNLPIDRYKARIRSEKDEALVAKWLEQQSTTTVYIPLTAEEIAAANLPVEAKSAAPEAPTAETGESVPAATTGESESAPDSAGTAESSEAVAAPEAPEATEPVATAETEAPAAEPEVAEAPEAVAEPESSSPPVEPLKNWAAVEAHFMAHHSDTAVKAVTRIKVPGNVPGRLLAPSLLALLRMEVEQQQRFPMQLVQDLCRDLEKESLKFFKRDKKSTFVCRTRPHFIEDESHLSPRLRSIVGVVRANPGINVAKLVSTLAPHLEKPAAKAEAPKSPEPEATKPAAPEAVPAIIPEAEVPASTEAMATGSPAAPEALPAETVTETQAGEITAEVTPAEAAQASAEGPAAGAPAQETAAPREPRGPKPPRQKKAPPAPAAPPAPLTSEEIGVLQDLRWLVQEGLVTEFASGELQLLGRAPQPPAEKKPREAPPKAVSVTAAPETSAEAPTEVIAPIAESPGMPAEPAPPEETLEAPPSDATSEPAAPAGS